MIQDSKRYPVNEILPQVKLPNTVKKEGRIVLDGDRINIKSIRLNCFKQSHKCAICGCEGEYFIKEKSIESDNYHLNMYGTKDGKEVSFSKNKIDKKGTDIITNYRTVCDECLHKINEGL